MYSMVEWSPDLDLTDFYKLAAKKGFVNNNSQSTMINCFENEEQFQAWILYYNQKAVGSVASHSLPEIGNSAFRICVRTCVLTELLPDQGLRTLRVITEHNNPTAQFFIPACIEWAGRDKELYVSSNNSEHASQRLVHNIYFPALAKTGVFTKHIEMEYRGHLQTFWKLNVNRFYQQLEYYGKWQ